MSRALCLTLAVLALLPSGAAAQAPAITAPAGIVMEATTGDVVWQKEADTRRPIASTTKLMTALVVLDEGPEFLKRTVTAPRYVATSSAESIVGLKPGEKITVQDLLRALLVKSANDAAFVLADFTSGSVDAFVARMNERAAELGLDNTSYANPIGLDDPDNFSTARDLATLARVLRENRFFRHTVDAADLALRSGAPREALENSNDLLDLYGWVNGVKTGYTSGAGEVLVASGRKNDVPIISVVLGAATETLRDQESVELLNWGFEKFAFEQLLTEDERLRSLPIVHRAGAELPVVAARSVSRVIRGSAERQVTVDLPEEVEGPIAFGERIGQASVTVDGETVATVPLVAGLKVPEAGLGRRAQNFLIQPWTLVVLGVILLLAVAWTQRRGPQQRGRARTAS